MAPLSGVRASAASSEQAPSDEKQQCGSASRKSWNSCWLVTLIQGGANKIKGSPESAAPTAEAVLKAPPSAPFFERDRTTSHYFRSRLLQQRPQLLR